MRGSFYLNCCGHTQIKIDEGGDTITVYIYVFFSSFLKICSTLSQGLLLQNFYETYYNIIKQFVVQLETGPNTIHVMINYNTIPAIWQKHSKNNQWYRKMPSNR